MGGGGSKAAAKPAAKPAGSATASESSPVEMTINGGGRGQEANVRRAKVSNDGPQSSTYQAKLDAAKNKGSKGDNSNSAVPTEGTWEAPEYDPYPISSYNLDNMDFGPDAFPEDGERVPCPCCGRQFAPDRLEAHKAICQKVRKERTPFDIQGQRMKPEQKKAMLKAQAGGDKKSGIAAAKEARESKAAEKKAPAKKAPAAKGKAGKKK